MHNEKETQCWKSYYGISWVFQCWEYMVEGNLTFLYHFWKDLSQLSHFSSQCSWNISGNHLLSPYWKVHSFILSVLRRVIYFSLLLLHFFVLNYDFLMDLLDFHLLEVNFCQKLCIFILLIFKLGRIYNFFWDFLIFHMSPKDKIFIVIFLFISQNIAFCSKGLGAWNHCI